MSESEVPSSQRISTAYKSLIASAEGLRLASDEFCAPIRELDVALDRLKLGLVTWKKMAGEDDGFAYWSRDVGYARISGTWGLAIRSVRGRHSWDKDDIEEWLFEDAPNSMRIEALAKLPELLEELIRNADKTARKLRQKTPEAKEVAAALRAASEELKAERKAERKERS